MAISIELLCDYLPSNNSLKDKENFMNYNQLLNLPVNTQPILTCPEIEININKNPFTIDVSILFCNKMHCSTSFMKMNDQDMQNMTQTVDSIIYEKSFLHSC